MPSSADFWRLSNSSFDFSFVTKTYKSQLTTKYNKNISQGIQLPNHPKNLGSVVLERVQNESETWQNPPHKRLEMGQCRTVADQQQLQRRNSRFCRIGSNCLTNWFMCIYICMYIYIYWYSTYFSIFQNISKSNWKPTWRPLATVFHMYSYNFLFPLFPSISLTLKPPVRRRCSPIQFGSLSPGQRCQNGCLMTFYKPYRPCRHMQAYAGNSNYRRKSAQVTIARSCS